MRNAKKIFLTTLSLTMTSFLMKTVAVWFNVYLTGCLGSAGIGLFGLISSVYALAKTFASAGMNLSATRLCIDDFSASAFTMKKLLPIAFSIGLISQAVLFFCSNFFAQVWIADSGAKLPLQILSFSLPFIALSSALNGYMTAARKMSRYSVIQLIEQISRIVITVVVISNFCRENAARALSCLCLGITASEVISFSLSLFSYRRDRRSFCADKKYSGFLRKMARLAVPDALGTYIRSGLNTLEHLLIPIGIRKSGASSQKALSDYGAVQGMALPVILYPSALFGVVSGLLVPEIAECKIKKNEKEVNYIINRVLHIALLFSLIIMALMIGHAKELSQAIYKTDEAYYFILLLSPLIPIMYLDMTTDGMLKGLDMQLSIMKINVLDSVICVVLVFFLVPKMAVDGYLFTIYFAEIINFLFSFFLLCRKAKLHFSFWRNLLSPLLCSGAAIACGRLLLGVTGKPTPDLILSIGVGLILYSVLLRLTGSISKEDAQWMKGLIR